VTTTTKPTVTRQATNQRSAIRPVLRFTGHFVEMVIAMFVGMMALAPLWTLAWPGLTDRPDAHALIMATDMAIGMALWMWIRRHGWSPIAEMTAAMYAPFVVLLVPYWLGAISGDTLMAAGHVLMIPAMLAAMLLRPGHYSH
jgi:hypothetical protein